MFSGDGDDERADGTMPELGDGARLCTTKAKEMEDELIGLKSWKVGMEKKLECSEKVRKEHEEHLEMLRKVLEDKEKEINDANDQIRQAKEAAVREYCDFDALLEELGVSYADRFNDALRQAKKAYPDLLDLTKYPSYWDEPFSLWTK